MTARIVVLASGSGTTLQAILDDPQLRPAVVAAGTDVPGCAAMCRARDAGIPTFAEALADHADRDAWNDALGDAIAAHDPDLVVLAGFMRILGASFVERYAGRMINIHPSLLPAYPGTQTHRRALAERATRHGCTVHFVTADVDGGPIIAQADVPVHAGDDEATLAARVLEQEHRLLPQVVAAFCEGRVVLDGGRARIADAARR